MSYNGTDLSPDPLYLQPKGYDARSDRKWYADFINAGVSSAPTTTTGDYAVTYSGGTLVLNVAAGVAYILGGNIADQGMYRQYISAGTTVTCPAADGTNPRIDTVILRSFDNAADGSGLNKGRVEVVPGTPTAGATLANLNGKSSLASLTDVSLSYVILAYILVPAGATVLTNTATNVKDARTVLGIKPASIYGFPNDATKVLKGDGSWGAAASPFGAVLYDSGILGASAASIDSNAGGAFSSVGYSILQIDIVGRSDRASGGDEVLVRLNNDSGTNYVYFNHFFFAAVNETSGTGDTSWRITAGYLPTANSPTDAFGLLRIEIPNPASSTRYKNFMGQFTGGELHATANYTNAISGGQWKNTAAITRVAAIAAGTSNLVAGSRMIVRGRA